MTEETSTADEDVGDDWAAAMSEQAVSEAGSANDFDELEQAKLQNLQADNSGSAGSANLEAILDIPVSLSVQIGQTKISIKNKAFLRAFMILTQ